MSRPQRAVACPACGKPAAYGPANPHRPFCSERCKMIDLGAWASESYRVPAEEQRAGDEEPSATPPES